LTCIGYLPHPRLFYRVLRHGLPAEVAVNNGLHRANQPDVL
jgi:hypothetical protein